MLYPWYEIITAQSLDIQQGDFIPECPILIPPINFRNIEEPEVEVKLINSVILSQSCDLVNGKVEIVLVCPYYSLDIFLNSLPPENTNTKKAKEKTIDNLKKGHLPGYHLLNKHTEIIKDYQVVDFKNVYGIQFEALKEIANNTIPRIRLLPPYREHLSQAFARYFMRVGLPQDIIIEY